MNTNYTNRHEYIEFQDSLDSRDSCSFLIIRVRSNHALILVVILLLDILVDSNFVLGEQNYLFDILLGIDLYFVVVHKMVDYKDIVDFDLFYFEEIAEIED